MRCEQQLHNYNALLMHCHKWVCAGVRGCVCIGIYVRAGQLINQLS